MENLYLAIFFIYIEENKNIIATKKEMEIVCLAAEVHNKERLFLSRLRAVGLFSSDLWRERKCYNYAN